MSLILNTWIFVDRVEAGVPQADLVLKAKELGADGLEVRHEYFKDLANEAPAVKKAAEETGMIINLSVPDEVFVNGKVNPKLPEYFEEARSLGVSKIKFNTGDFANFNGDLKSELQIPADLEFNVENDQTEMSGHSKPVDEFLNAAEENGLNIGYVYDLGNWAVMGEDAIEAANTLGSHTRYIHLKNMEGADSQVTDDLNRGKLDWKAVMETLPKVDVAIEFPIKEDDDIVAQIKLVREEMDK